MQCKAKITCSEVWRDVYIVCTRVRIRAALGEGIASDTIVEIFVSVRLSFSGENVAGPMVKFSLCGFWRNYLT